ncbi:cytochrome P450 [Marinitenerispora sediminis]|uniref:Cytochrome P450 n=1 Tax=Marinitenerispora sediminis TaxID=1931232 RepID=A0A368SZL6_9ACTN|nr:cytochrome P450 [Marinitenerispora sediminis]RCV48377.1 cytochrome P450 [Marinitenerispora sediminis]RCV50706.1 cytochrome P450 [Marinitenerispora sediminis]RCV51310.1 cytochrome P450 [Marinitenerispora sediminis]
MTPQDTAIELPAPAPGTPGPPCAYAALRADQPIARVRTPRGDSAWLVTRHEDVRAVLADPRLVRPLMSEWPPGRPAAEHAGLGVRTLLEMTGDQHARVRRIIAPLFSPRRVARYAPRVRALAERLAGGVEAAGPPADLVAGFTEPLPLMVLCDVVGFPYEERDRYLPLTDAVLRATALPLDEVLAALAALQEYVTELIERRRTDPGDDLLGELLAGVGTQTGLTREELVSFAASVLMAGYKTNVQHLGNALLTLLADPGRPRRLREAPELLPSAVEELLRHVPLMNAIVVTVATEDLTLCGRRIRAGEAVLPVIASANRDGAVFPDADRVDLERTPNPHLAFGHGPHYCPGGHLTRLQLRVALATLLHRFPGLELAVPADRLDWDEENPLRAPLALPVRW